jgi:hypothetical protein
MTFLKTIGSILAIFLVSAVLYCGFVGYQPTPTQVRTDITASVTHK